MPLVNMEDDVCYSTLEFSTPCPEVLKDAGGGENVVYSEIRVTREEASQSKHEIAEEVASSKCTSYRQVTAILGILSVLLLAGLTAMCVLNIMQISKYTSILARYTNESAAHRMLLAEKAVLESDKEQLRVERDQFKMSLLQIITQFSTFPVKKYCTMTNEGVNCETCMKYWIQNGSSCYLFQMTKPWLTWTDSKNYCLEMGGHLVVIDSQEEQEFISEHTTPYYDTYHGYWIGLTKKDNLWMWSTGAVLQSNGSWTNTSGRSQANCVLSNPNRNNLNNWEVNMCYMLNRYICEMKTMTWPM